MKNWNEILEMNNSADWPKCFKKLITKADTAASEFEKKAFAKWFDQQEWWELNTIDQTSEPGDHFSFAEGTDWLGNNEDY